MDAPQLALAPADAADDPEAPTVTLHEAATLLGITEAAVLLRVIRGSLPSQVDRDGDRRVPLTALSAALEGEAQPQAPPDLTALTAAFEALARELDALRARIAVLELRQNAAPRPLAALVGSLAEDLKDARARIAARRSRQPGSHPRSRRP